MYTILTANEAVENTKDEVKESLSILQRLTAPFKDSEFWVGVFMNVVWSLMIIIAALIIIKILQTMIKKVFNIGNKNKNLSAKKRDETLVELLRNISIYAVWFIAITAIFDIFGVPIRGLLAGAGIIGLAVGFGAQSLVKDVITGFFILFENQFSVGDYVKINSSGTLIAEGTILSLGLRSTRVKSITGEITILPNGSIMEVVNYSMSNIIAVSEIPVNTDDDIDEAMKSLEELFAEMPNHYHELVAPPEILGVDDISYGVSTIKVIAECLPNQHYGIERAIRKDAKKHLEENGFKKPLQQMVLNQHIK